MNKCIVCESSSNTTLYEGILKCKDCGYVYADLDFSDEEFSRLYDKKYFFGEEYSNYVADKKVHQKNFRLRWKVLRKFLDSCRHRNLLEIGSAYGFFLDQVRNEFATVQGIDIAQDGARYARETLNLDVLCGDFLTSDFGDRSFDVVCMWDTIEHLPQPQLFLQKIKKVTQPGALLAITTGDIDSANARAMKRKWRLIHPPTHAHYFSRKTLSELLRRNHFEVLYSRYCGFYRSIDNIAYNILVLRRHNRRLYDLIGKSGTLRLCVYLNLYDIRYVIARRISENDD